MPDTIFDTLSGAAKMQIRNSLPDVKGWIANTIVRCENDSVNYADNAAWTLRKFIDLMENPVALANFKRLLAELEEMNHDRE